MPDWSVGDVDAGRLWAGCGGQWLTDPGVAVPVELVRGVVGITTWLDDAGAGLDDLFGNLGAGVLAERAASLQLGRSGRVSSGGASRLARCADGWIAVTLARPEDLASVPAWLGTEVGDGDVWPIVEAELATVSVGSTIERAGWLGIACAAVGERREPRSGIRVERHGAADASPVAGLVVANLASLWAGPLAADVLARCGARVISIESTSRPDGGRAVPAFFDDLHEGCESVALDLADDTGRRRLRELLERVDVVIEGSRPRALQQLGIEASSVARRGPRIWASITGHGRDEAHAHRIGFGDDTAAAGGLVGRVGGEPRFIADAVADPIAGLAVAATVVQLAGAGGRWLVDAPLAGVAAAHARDAAVTATRFDSVPPSPRRRRGAGRPLGSDTAGVLAEFGVA